MVAVAVVAHALVPGMSWGAHSRSAPSFHRRTRSRARPSCVGSTSRGTWSARRGGGSVQRRDRAGRLPVAVAAVVAGSFSLARRRTEVRRSTRAGGIAIGLAVGWLIAEIRKRTDDTQIEHHDLAVQRLRRVHPRRTRSAPSGVLAAVTTGIYMGIRGPSIIPARTRLQGFFVWDILDFLINASLFVLVGLQLRRVVERSIGYSTGTFAAWAIAVAPSSSSCAWCGSSRCRT